MTDAGEPMHANRLALLGRRVAMVVHDAVQPVASVATRGQSALRWLRHDPPDVRAAIASLERLVADAQRAGTLLAELRMLASPVARPRQAVLLATVLRDTLHWLDDDMRRHGIDVETDIGHEDIVVLAEPAALQQLFANLMVNALEAMADTPLPARRLTVRLAASGPDAVIAISDRGCGIAADALPRLFDAFHTTKDDGVGVGLAICHRIVTDLSGSIRAENRRDGGARFEVHLPRQDQTASRAATT
jgi:C4-dicarboxylate-specific signal transduction histidine kinase